MRFAIGIKEYYGEAMLHVTSTESDEELKKSAYRKDWGINIQDLIKQKEGYMEFLGFSESEINEWIARLINENKDR